jgi:hypothetical protein
MRWLERCIRRERKRRRRAAARNVRAYRRRQRQAGMRRIDVVLPQEQHAALVQWMRPGETISQAVDRLLDSLRNSGARSEKPNDGAL